MKYPILISLAFGLNISAQATVLKSTEYKLKSNATTSLTRLPNGLTVVLTTNMDAPLVSVVHWVRVGSIHEKPGVTGIAHLFEHMMFRPLTTKDVGFFDHVKKLGGSANANTRFTATVYTTTVPEENIEKLLALESNRFRKLKVTDELLNIERKAVWSEYSTKIDSNPVVDLWDTIYRAAFPGHPLGWMIMGERADLEKIKASDCNQFFARYYLPNNTGLFISGPIKQKQLLEKIKSLYGSWKRGEDSPPLEPFVPREPRMIQARGKLKSEAKNMLVGFRIPEYDLKNVLTMNVAEHILFASQNSLARQRLKHQMKMASEIVGFNFEYDNALMKVFMVLLPHVPHDEAFDAILKLNADFAALKDEEFKAYLQEYAIETSESLLRNENLNDSVSYAWGKLGGIDRLQQAMAQPIPISKNEIADFISATLRRENSVSVLNKETP